jgi:hypothetical protein
LFFFVIFGLVYEALADSTSESAGPASTHQLAVTAALEALKYLARPEFSGRALQESVVFDELVNLCYRIVMTESAVVQPYLVEAIAPLAMHPSDSDQFVSRITRVPYICSITPFFLSVLQNIPRGLLHNFTA